MTKVFGIVNITPDSNSGDGTFDMDVILNYVKKTAKLGLYGVDVGAVASNYHLKEMSVSKEMDRLENRLPEIIKLAHNLNLKVSLDSFTPEVIEFGLENGIDYINDITGFRNSKIVDLAVKCKNVKCVVMHSISVPAVKGEIPETVDIVKFIIDWAKERIDSLRELKERLIIDIGIGFSKSGAQDFKLINNMKKIKESIDVPIYIGHSRKFFLHNNIITDVVQKDLLTAIITQELIKNKCDYLRLHNLEYANLNLILADKLHKSDND